MKLLIVLFTLLSTLSCYGQEGGETCASATQIGELPFSARGNILSAINDFKTDCNGETKEAPDHVFEYTVGQSDSYLNFVCSDPTDFIYQISIYENDCTSEPIFCKFGYCGLGASFNENLVSPRLTGGETYYIVIEGHDVDNADGNYHILIKENIAWYVPESTTLPLILIQTNDQEIVDEPKVMATMKIIDNGPGSLNHPTDSANGYDGEIGIEIRGSSSASFPQTPYGIETRDSDGSNKNVSLFDMPEENDWILISNYNDKVLFRNVLSFDLFERMGHYAPRTQLCEVVVNDEYQGIYVFTERIKKDQNRVDVSTLKEDENEGDDLTGGYLFKVDYEESGNSWKSNYRNPNYLYSAVHYVYNYPDENDITDEQKAYLQSAVSAFEAALWGDDFMDPMIGYGKYIDVPSFIDYFIVSEFSRNVDGYKKSRNFYKDKDSNDPLIYAGPVWDFDWAYKDHQFTGGRNWRFNYGGQSDVTPPGWYMRLMQDPVFRSELDARYRALRLNELNTTRIFGAIDSLAALVDGAQQRHYAKWPILGLATPYGTPEIGSLPETYEEEVIQFKNWIEERLTWLDENMSDVPYDPLPISLNSDVSFHPLVSIYPNPSAGFVNVETHNGIEIDHVNLYHIDGSLVKSYQEKGTNLLLQVPDLKGIYLIVIQTKEGIEINRRLVIR